MTTEMISLKLDSEFLKDIDNTVKKGRYHNRTEFIREALRVKVNKEELNEARKKLDKIRGSLKSNMSDEEFERLREKAALEAASMSEEEQEKFMKGFPGTWLEE